MKMARQSSPRARLSVSVTPVQKEFLEDVAQRSEVSLTRVIRQAIAEFVTKYSDRQLPLFETRRPFE